MKLLCLGYYDKFARFFIAIEKESKKNNSNLQFELWNTHFSGYLYAFLRRKSTKWLGGSIGLKLIFTRKKNKTIKEHHQGIAIRPLMQQLLQNHPKIAEKKASSFVIAYIDYIHQKLNIFKPTHILMVGDARLPFLITKQLAKLQNIPVWHVEQGPFGTTVFDAKGVNANAAIRTTPLSPLRSPEIEQKIESFIHRPKEKKYKRSPFYRGMDYFLEYLLGRTSLFSPDLKEFHFFQKKHSLKNHAPLLQTSSPLFLLICQVPFDVNMTHHSPHFSNHFSILKAVHENLPSGVQLVVREHPIYRGRYEKEFYTYLQKQQIAVDTNKNATTLLEKAQAIVVNNSTLGLEAIARNKAVVVLGNAYYDREHLCLKLHKQQQLAQLLAKAQNFQLDKAIKNAFLARYFFHYLVDGFITDKSSKAAQQIAHQLEQYCTKPS